MKEPQSKLDIVANCFFMMSATLLIVTIMMVMIKLVFSHGAIH